MIDEELIQPEIPALVVPEKETPVKGKSLAQAAVEEITGFNKNNDPIFRLRSRSPEETIQMIRLFTANKKGELTTIIKEAEQSGEIEVPVKLGREIKELSTIKEK